MIAFSEVTKIVEFLFIEMSSIENDEISRDPNDSEQSSTSSDVQNANAAASSSESQQQQQQQQQPPKKRKVEGRHHYIFVLSKLMTTFDSFNDHGYNNHGCDNHDRVHCYIWS